MDPLPGWKTKITSTVMAVFNIINAMGWLDVEPATVSQINNGLIALIGLFLAMKIDRK